VREKCLNIVSIAVLTMTVCQNVVFDIHVLAYLAEARETLEVHEGWI
jgi:hypothetical protein